MLFASSRIGEFSYGLNLSAVESPPVTLPQLTAALGKQSKHLLDIINPTEKTATFVAHVVDSPNFSLSGSGITHPTKSWTLNIGPKESSQIQVIFSPSSSGTLVTGSLEVYSSCTGKEAYILKVSQMLKCKYVN